MLILLIILLLVLGAGGGYYGHSRWGLRWWAGAWELAPFLLVLLLVYMLGIVH